MGTIVFSGNTTVTLNDNLNMKETLTIDTRTYMSVQFLLGACLYCRKCWEIEKNNLKELAIEDKYYSIGAVILSFSTIESTINELYQDIDDNFQMNRLSQLIDEEKKQKLLSVWKDPNNPNTFQKYQRFLQITEQTQFHKNKQTINEPYIRFDDLRILRNAISHYHPETSNNLRKHMEIENIFQKYNFTLNPFFDGLANTFFTDKCFGHGIAEWSINTAIDFIDSFFLE